MKNVYHINQDSETDCFHSRQWCFSCCHLSLLLISVLQNLLIAQVIQFIHARSVVLPIQEFTSTSFLHPFHWETKIVYFSMGFCLPIPCTFQVGSIKTSQELNWSFDLKFSCFLCVSWRWHIVEFFLKNMSCWP